jgi:hypothetical protein
MIHSGIDFKIAASIARVGSRRLYYLQGCQDHPDQDCDLQNHALLFSPWTVLIQNHLQSILGGHPLNQKCLHRRQNRWNHNTDYDIIHHITYDITKYMISYILYDIITFCMISYMISHMIWHIVSGVHESCAITCDIIYDIMCDIHLPVSWVMMSYVKCV